MRRRRAMFSVHGCGIGWPFVRAVYARNAIFMPLARSIVIRREAARDRYEPAWRSPTRASTRSVVFTPCWPESSVWFEAVLHASHPVARIARASAAGVLKRG